MESKDTSRNETVTKKSLLDVSSMTVKSDWVTFEIMKKNLISK